MNTKLKLHQGVAETRVHVEEVIENGVIAGTNNQENYKLSKSHTLREVAAINQILHQMAKTADEVKREREISSARMLSLRKQIEITQHQIQLCTIVAPGSGRLAMLALPDTFVEKGDLLFEVNP